RRLNAHDMAADIWDAAELEDAKPLVDWLAERDDCTEEIDIPEERPAALVDSPLFADNAVYFGRRHAVHIDFDSRPAAELLARLANLGLTGRITIPRSAPAAIRLLDAIDVRIEKARGRFEELANSRTGDDDMREQLVEL